MKQLIFLLLISILFQSCFSYKSVDFKSISSEKKQKFEVEKLDKTRVKGRIVSIDENIIILENKGKSQTISKDEIYDMKVRKFSIIKTASGVLGTYGIVVIILPIILVSALLISAIWTPLLLLLLIPLMGLVK